MKKAYSYVFYKFYLWQYAAFGNTSLPKFTAVLQLSTIVIFNIMTFLIAIQVISKLNIVDSLFGSRYFQWSLAGLIVAFNYFILMYNKMDEKIIAEFNNESGNEKRKRTLYTYLYVVGSIILLALSVVYLVFQ